MTNILQDLSSARVAQALDANKIAFGTLLSTLPRAALHTEPGLRWFETGVPDELFNGVVQTQLEQEALPAAIERVLAHFQQRRLPFHVVQTQLEQEALPAAIERVLAHFQQRRLPFHWHVGPSSQSTNFGDLLAAHGIGHVEDEPGMAVDLLTLNKDLPLASNLTIQPVTTDELLHQWTRAWGCGAPEEVIRHWFTVYSCLPLGPERSLRLYLGSIAGKPVATVELFLEAGVAAINHVVTLHQFRQQGIGAMMTLMAAREARQAGYRISVLTASPMGVNIYRRLGFKECCLVSTYEWSPAIDFV